MIIKGTPHKKGTEKPKESEIKNMDDAIKTYKIHVSNFNEVYKSIHEILDIFMAPIPPSVAKTILREQNERINRRIYEQSLKDQSQIDLCSLSSQPKLDDQEPNIEDLMKHILKQTSEMYEKMGYTGNGAKLPFKVKIDPALISETPVKKKKKQEKDEEYVAGLL